MIAVSAARLFPAISAFPVHNLWAAVAILANTLSASAAPTLKGAPVAPLPEMAQVAEQPLPGLRGACERGLSCTLGNDALPATIWWIRTPSRTRTWRYRSVFA
jgi:hypothetical protein